MQETFIGDEEILYRCVFHGNNVYEMTGNILTVKSQAFTDRNHRPSVDLASRCDSNPCHTQKSDKDGVVSLIVKNVRAIDEVVQNDPKGNPEFSYKIDVIYRPLDENFAHAQIEPSPEYRNPKPFRKLLASLAYLANQREWEILPYELRR